MRVSCRLCAVISSQKISRGLGIKHWFKNWLSRRAISRPTYTLTQNNIYIFPSKQGAGFGALLCLMLLTAINYQSSLIYLLTFVLGGMFAVSIWLCFFNMQGMSIRVAECPPVRAGDRLTLELSSDSTGKQRSGFFAALDGQTRQAWEVERNPVVHLRGNIYSRGVYPLPAVKLETYFPFGLVRAWTWMWFDSPVSVYPKPLQAPNSCGGGDTLDVEAVQNRYLSDELNDIKRYRGGDNVRRVLWRHYARHGELVVRAEEELYRNSAVLDFEAYREYGTELALSYLAYDVLALSESNAAFSLLLPSCEVGQGEGMYHRDQCLRCLAAFK